MVRRSIAWMSFGQISFFLLQLAGSVVIARLLGPYDMGVFAVAIAAVGLIAVIQSVGLDNYIVRERELTPGIIATANTVNWIIGLILAAAILALGIAGGALFREPGVRHVLSWLAIVPLIGCTAFVPQAMLEREGDFRLLSLIRAGSTLLGLGVTVLFALHGYRYMSLAYSQIITAVLTNVAINALAWRHVNLRLSLAHWRPMSRFGAQIFAVAGIFRISQRVIEIAMGRLLGLSALGLYSRASTNHNQIWDSVHGILARVVFTDLSRHAREGWPIGPRYLTYLAMLTGVLWPMLLGVAVLSRPVIWTIYGPDWLGAAAPLAWLCLGAIILTTTALNWEVFVVSDELGVQARLEITRTLIGVALFIGGCFISLEAAAASRVIDSAIAQALYRPHMERLTGLSAAAFRGVYAKSGAAMLAAAAPSAALMAAYGFSPRTPVELIAPAVVAGIALWLLALRALQHPLFPEIERLVRKFIPQARTT